MRFKDIHSAYLGILGDVYGDPQFRCAPRGQAIREILDYKFTIENPIAEPIVTLDPERNRVIEEYTRKEVELYNSGSNKVEDFAKASTFWSKLANPDGTVNSAYGHLIWHKKSVGNRFEAIGSHIKRTVHESGAITMTMPNTYDQQKLEDASPFMRTPWDWCVQALKADKDTRQAILRFSLPEHHWVGVKDFTCTMHGNFLIRDNKLHLSVVMRSNDVVLGLAYDLPWFVSLMDYMLADLREMYPDLEKGSYTHLSHSMHVYDRDEAKIRKMLGL